MWTPLAARTDAAREAERLVRDPALFKWYAVALLAFVIYAYAVEVERGRWDVVAAGLAVWFADWFNDCQRPRAAGDRPRAAMGLHRPDRLPVPRRPQRRDLVHVRPGGDRLRQAPPARPARARGRHPEPGGDRARPLARQRRG